MNDAAFETQKARLQALADAWVKPIGLGWWRLDLSYDRTGEDFADAKSIDHGFRSGVIARCFADWRYGVATIVWNMPEVADKDDDGLEQAFVHELMHVFLHETREWLPTGADEHGDGKNHEERVATTLAKAFIWIRDRARDGEWAKPDEKGFAALEAMKNE